MNIPFHTVTSSPVLLPLHPEGVIVDTNIVPVDIEPNAGDPAADIEVPENDGDIDNVQDDNDNEVVHENDNVIHDHDDDDNFDDMPALVDNFAPGPEHVPPWCPQNKFKQNINTLFSSLSISLVNACVRTFQTNCPIKSVKMCNNQIIFDSGASTCATSDVSIIKNIIHGEGVKATPAFGPPITSTASGTYGPLDLDIILMKGMQETLVSVSQLCQGGTSNCQNIVIFTSEGMRCFTYESSRTALQLVDQVGVEVVRGYISNGVYIHDPHRNIKSKEKSINTADKINNIVLQTASMFLAQFKPSSLYDHVHMVTGHPGIAGMAWHLKNSTNAKYTEEDASRQRGTCKG